MIKELRHKLAMTQEEFAYLLDVSVNSVSNWERGIVKPDKRNLKAIKEVAQDLVGMVSNGHNVTL